MYSESPEVKRVEFRSPELACNPYLTFSALLLAELNGNERGIELESHSFGPLDRNIYELSAADKAEIVNVPGSLDESALERDPAVGWCGTFCWLLRIYRLYFPCSL